jgi:hypothetical protein
MSMQIRWRRVVLDEAHNIKVREAGKAASSCTCLTSSKINMLASVQISALDTLKHDFFTHPRKKTTL